MSVPGAVCALGAPDVAPGAPLPVAFGSEPPPLWANPVVINAPAIRAILIVCIGRVIWRKHLCRGLLQETFQGERPNGPTTVIALSFDTPRGTPRRQQHTRPARARDGSPT